MRAYSSKHATTLHGNHEHLETNTGNILGVKVKYLLQAKLHPCVLSWILHYHSMPTAASASLRFASM